MKSYVESNDTSISTGLKQHNNYFVEKLYSLSPIYGSWKKANRRSGFKDGIPLCNWTMPAQPEGYIRAGKYDLL